MYLDTANIEEIKEGLRVGIFKGVTTNPTILKKENRKREEQIKDILGLGVKELFVQVLGETSDEMFEDYLKIKDIEHRNMDIVSGSKIAIKVPLTIAGLETVKRIKKDERTRIVLGTAIYSADQGILGAIAGCDYLAPYYNRMQNNSVDSDLEISKMRMFIDDRNLNTKIVAASFKNAGQVVNSLMNGAHTCTIPLDIAKAMADKDAALNALRVFNEDGKVCE